MRADRVLIAVATPPGVAVLYFLLADEVSGSEAIAAAAVVLVAGFYGWALARCGTTELRITARGMLSLLRGYAGVVPDSWRVGRGLLRAIYERPKNMLGNIKHVPFRVGGQDGDDVGRRAAVVTALSLAPNGFSIGQEGDTLLIHQLVPDSVGADREWPL